MCRPTRPRDLRCSPPAFGGSAGARARQATSTMMRHYQKLLLSALEQHGWQLEERNYPEQWWVAELWVVQSIRHQHGFRVYCTFLVDPQAERSGDLSAVREIAFTPEPIEERR